MLLTKDPAVVTRSYEKAGWDNSSAKSGFRREVAERRFANWEGPKLRLDYQDVAAGLSLFDPGRVAAPIRKRIAAGLPPAAPAPEPEPPEEGRYAGEPDDRPLDFVWRYVADESRGDELRFSIRSALKHYRGEARIWVVGDRPDWYAGRYVPCPRASKVRHLDTAHKFAAMAACGEIDDTFCSMMDDVYLMKPLGFHDLAVPHAQNRKHYTPERVRGKAKSHAELKRATARALHAAGYARVPDYGTHTPKIYRRSEIGRWIEEFRMKQVELVSCLLFGTLQRHPRSPVAGPYRRVLQKGDVERGVRVDGRAILNHVDKAWSPALREALEARFPNPSPCERVDGLSPGPGEDADADDRRAPPPDRLADEIFGGGLLRAA